MTGPTIANLFASLPERFRPERAGDWMARFHFVLSGAERPEWTVEISAGRCRVAEGLAGEPACVVRMSAATYLKIERGETRAETAFLTGRVKVSNPRQMLRYVGCFRPFAAAEAPKPEAPAAAVEEDRSDLPLAGLLVVDLSRMLPGAILARQLLDLGARLVKVEDPAGGDPMRHLPPLVDGVGAGFAALLRGAESLALDLGDTADRARLRRLAARADVVVESFRPGTIEAWGLGAARLREANRGLVYCSLSAFGGVGEAAAVVGHDLNLVAVTGLLSLLPGDGVPPLQIADVGAGLLAASAILAALVRRARDGEGCVIDQPLVSGPLPFLAWALADRRGEGSVLESVLAGRTPCYRRYRCGDGREIALGAIEPKLWASFLELLSLEGLAPVGLDAGDEGAGAAAAIAAVLATRPRAEWLALAAGRGLPLSPVNELAEAAEDPSVASFLDSTTGVPGTFHPALGRRPTRRAPRLGEQTAAILGELEG